MLEVSAMELVLDELVSQNAHSQVALVEKLEELHSHLTVDGLSYLDSVFLH